jgi:hypothetical protein
LTHNPLKPVMVCSSGLNTIKSASSFSHHHLESDPHKGNFTIPGKRKSTQAACQQGAQL